MPDVNDFLVRMADLGDGATAQLGGYGVEGFNFGLGLDFVEGVAVGGVSDAEAVDGEGRVAGGERGVDVTVVVVVVG